MNENSRISLYIFSVFCIVTILSFFLDSRLTFESLALAPEIEWWLAYSTRLIVIIGMFIVVPLLFMIINKQYSRSYTFIGALIATFVVVLFIKIITHRMRPIESMEFWGPLNFAFPSMHAALIFASATLLRHWYKAFGILAIAYACLVAFSRIYFGYHFLSDTFTGALIGFGIGLYLIFLNVKRQNDAN
jgi:undecaprenyl-diphosphatase